MKKVADGSLALGLALMLAVLPRLAHGLGLIRDAEIETDIQRMSAPVLQAAGLGADSVRFYIVNDNTLNAFVAGGMNLFLNTGLIIRTERVDELLGVIAHEVGHIAGGHLSRIPEAQQQATTKAIAGAVLGLATALAGAPGLGTAIVAGGQSYAQEGLMRFSRGQEQAADQAAVTYLNRSDVSIQGLADFFGVLENESVLSVSRQNPYLQSHPLTRDRITFVKGQVARGPSLDQLPAGWAEAHARMVVKLEAFLGKPRDVLRRYQGRDDLPARYATAIALYRVPDLPAALSAIDALIAEHPDDPYFHELKGQMLFENGRIRESIPPYQASVRLAPDSGLLRVGLGRALLEIEDNLGAIEELEEALAREPSNAFAWRLLGIAQGRAGMEGDSFLSLAEYALLTGNEDDARLYISRASDRIDDTDPAWLRVQDIQRMLDKG